MYLPLDFSLAPSEGDLEIDRVIDNLPDRHRGHQEYPLKKGTVMLSPLTLRKRMLPPGYLHL